MGEHKHVHSVEEDDVELERLKLQEDTVDPPTIRHLETIGVSQGWKCLEVGAGAGSIAQWLSNRVGATGKVVATDLNTKFLNLIHAPNLEIRQHNILKDELEEGQFDLVHCRKLLIHLPKPEKAVKRMADALRPGGWLLVEEDDYGSILSLDVTNPSLAPLTAVLRTVYDALRERGIADVYFGRRVRGLVEGLGFMDLGQEGWTFIGRGGEREPESRVAAAAWQSVSKPMIAAGVITQEQSESIHRMQLDPTYYYPFYTLFCAWGRKPVGERRN